MSKVSYTNNKAYSGPYPIRPNALASVDVDIFGLNTIRLQRTSPLRAIEPSLPPMSLSVDKFVECNLTGPQCLVKDAPKGMYRVTYLNGWINTNGNAPGFFNYGRHSRFGEQDYMRLITYQIWIRAGTDDNMYYFGEPVFKDPGYGSGPEAEAACRGANFAFYHPGGDINAFVDDENYFFDDNFGHIELRVESIICPNAEMPGFTGFWDIIWSSLQHKENWPTIRDYTQRDAHPVIENLSPGIHLLRFQLEQTIIGCPWLQDFYLRVWNMPPRLTPSCFYSDLSKDIPTDYRYEMENQHFPMKPSLFPVKPVKIFAPGGYKLPAAIHGSPPQQKPKYSGNEPERPESAQVYQRPIKLGDAEKF